LQKLDNEEQDIINKRLSKLVDVQIQTDKDDELQIYIENFNILETISEDVIIKNENEDDKNINGKIVIDIYELKIDTEKLVNTADLLTIYLSINKLTLDNFLSWFSDKDSK